jgi:hypothetical protein
LAIIDEIVESNLIKCLFEYIKGVNRLSCIMSRKKNSDKWNIYRMSHMLSQEGNLGNWSQNCYLTLMMYSLKSVIKWELKIYIFENDYKLLNSPCIKEYTYTVIENTSSEQQVHIEICGIQLK